jgi:hypothetical protein
MKSTVAPSPIIIILMCLLGIAIASIVVWARVHKQDDSIPQSTPLFDPSHIEPAVTPDMSNETETENVPEMTEYPTVADDVWRSAPTSTGTLPPKE